MVPARPASPDTKSRAAPRRVLPPSERDAGSRETAEMAIRRSLNAGEMFLSRNTVKSQVYSLCRKLGASTRSQAVTRSRELGLLEG